MLRLLLVLSAALFCAVSGQSTVLQGALSNGVPVTTSISQGDTHSWSFTVDPSQPQTGTALTGLVLALQSSIGQSYLYVTPPASTSLAVLQSTSQTSGNGVLLTNRSGVGVPYGSYLVQVLGVATDSYTLSATLSQRQQLTAGIPLAVGAISPPLTTSTTAQPFVYTYADYVVQQAGPWQMTLALSIDEDALISSGGALSAVVMPTVYWARGVDVLAWSPSTTATWSTAQTSTEQQLVSNLASLASAYDECTQPPCTYSFLIVPSVDLPVLPSMVVHVLDLSTVYSSALDYSLFPSYVPGTGGNSSISIATDIASLTVDYYRFPVYDPAVDLSFTLESTSTCRLVTLISLANPFPNLARQGYAWSLSLPGNTTLTLSWLDAYFTVKGSGGLQQSATMEGTYYVTVYAYGGSECSYQLTLELMDPTYSAGPGAPLLPAGVPVFVVTNRFGYGNYFRFITPSGFDPSTTDIVISSTNGYEIDVSDTSVTAAYGTTIATDWTPYGRDTIAVIVSSALGQVHVGTYFIKVITNVVNFTITASLITHTPLLPGNTYYNAQPLLTGQAALFEWSQVGLSSASMRLVLECSEPTAYGSLFVTTFPRSTPGAAVTAAWPVNRDSAQWYVIGQASSGGLMMGQYNYSCAAAADCVWLITVLAASPNGLLNYSLSLEQDNTDPPLSALSPNTPYSSVTVEAPYSAYFVVTPTQLAVLTFTLLASGTWQMWIDRDRSLLYGLARQPEYVGAAYGGADNITLTISPADPLFGVDAADNIGSPFIGSFYVQLTCSWSCTATPYTLTYSTSEYSGTGGVLEPLAVEAASPIYQSLLSGTYAYYSYQSPASITATIDLTFAVVSTGLDGTGSPSLFISTAALFPTLASGAYNYTSSGSMAASVLLSGSAIMPSTVYHIAVLADNDHNLNYSFTVSVSTRATMTAAGSILIADPVSAGSVVYVDFTLPGSLTPSAQPTYTFVAGVVCSALSGGMLPAMTYSSSLNSRSSSSPPTLTFTTNSPMSPAQPAPTGAYWSVGDGANTLCTLASCTWHLALLMPAGAAGCTFAISNIQTASQPLSPTPLPNNGTSITASVSTAAANWYTFTMPTPLMTGAIVTVTLTPSSAATQLNMQLSASGFPIDLSADLAASSRNGAPAVVSFNSSAAPGSLMYSSPVMLRSTYSVGVAGVVGGSYTITASIAAIAPVSTPNITGVLSLDPSVGNSSVVFASPTIMLLTIPDSYNASTDVMLVWQLESAYGQTMCAIRNVLPSIQGCWQINYNGLPRITPPIYYGFAPWLVVQVSVFNSILTPEVQAGDNIYVIASGTTGSVALFIQQRLQLTIGQTVQLSLSPNQPVLAQLSTPASKVSGSWQTPISFFAALTSTGTSSTSSLPAFVSMRNANNAASSLQPGYYNNGHYYSNPAYYDRVSGGGGATQSLTVSDVCTISVCTWQFMIWPTAPANASFGLSAPTPALPIVPAFSTAPTWVGQGAISTYTFTLPHAHMSLTITLQSLISGLYAGSSTNADLYVTMGNTRPGPDTSSWSSNTDTPTGTDIVTIVSTSTTSTANGTYYVGVFGQRAGWYTLTVTAVDAATVQPITLSLNTLVGGTTNVGASQYYQYQIGQVDALTDLSLVLIDSSGNQSAALPHPRLYSTFSYTQPGPVSGWLPPSLPYELIASTSSPNGVQQITLTSLLSSSNLLPLQSQHSLYVAVYCSPPSAGSGATTDFTQLVPYSISVSVTDRIFLTTDNSANSAVQFTRVSAGAVQYYQFNFTQSSSASAAILVLTGEASAIAALPAVYVADPTVTVLVDPVVSTPQSYTAVMSPATSMSASVPAYNALMLPLTALCPSGGTTGQSGCVWKAMVFNASPMTSYSFAVTTNTAASIQPLSPNTPVIASRAGGLFAYYSFPLTAGVSAAIISLTTLDQVGNVDLFVSTTNAYPYYAFNSSSGTYQGSQWQSTLDGGTTQPDTVWLNSSSGSAFVTPATYYVAVFAQRAAAFTLMLTVPGQSSPTSSASSSSSSFLSSASFSSLSSSTRGRTSTTSSSLPASSSSSLPSTTSSAVITASSTGSSSSSSAVRSSSSSSPTPHVTASTSNESSGLSRGEVIMLASLLPVVGLLCLLVGLLSVALLRRNKVPGKRSIATAESSSNRLYAGDSGVIELPSMSDQHDDNAM